MAGTLDLTERQIREVVAEASPRELQDNPHVGRLLSAVEALLDSSDPEYRWVYEDQVRTAMDRIRGERR